MGNAVERFESFLNLSPQLVEGFSISKKNFPELFKQMTKDDLCLILHSVAQQVTDINTAYNSNLELDNPVSNILSAMKQYKRLAEYRHFEENYSSRFRYNDDFKGSVYVMHMSDGSVKIGCSKTPEKRIASLAASNQATLVDSWFSSRTLSYRKLERKAHRHFKSTRLGGEFFSTKFQDAVDFVNQSVIQENV